MNKVLLQNIQKVLGTRAGEIIITGQDSVRFVVRNTASENEFLRESARRLSNLDGVESCKLTKIPHNGNLIVDARLELEF